MKELTNALSLLFLASKRSFKSGGQAAVSPLPPQ